MKAIAAQDSNLEFAGNALLLPGSGAIRVGYTVDKAGVGQYLISCIFPLYDFDGRLLRFGDRVRNGNSSGFPLRGNQAIEEISRAVTSDSARLRNLAVLENFARFLSEPRNLPLGGAVDPLNYATIRRCYVATLILLEDLANAHVHAEQLLARGDLAADDRVAVTSYLEAIRLGPALARSKILSKVEDGRRALMAQLSDE